jgi:hypothetical protein
MVRKYLGSPDATSTSPRKVDLDAVRPGELCFVIGQRGDESLEIGARRPGRRK